MLWVVPQKRSSGRVAGGGLKRLKPNNLERTVITVKKLIALLLIVACVCVGTVGCGGESSKSGGGAPKTEKAK